MTSPEAFGPYQLIERIHVGGMAEVFRARDLRHNRWVAIKRILRSAAEDEEFVEMFRDEAVIATQLAHPNIAKIYDVGRIDPSYYLALEFIDGKDLRSVYDKASKNRAPIPIEFILHAMAGVCMGLEHAHNHADAQGKPLQLVHRDVSPANVLVSFEGDVKVIDFGIAKAAGKLTHTQVGTIKGKFGYMSPEQVRGLPLDRRSDIFSLGICLWELLTLERLFTGDSEIAIMEKIRGCEVTPPSTICHEVPEELERVVLKALAKDVDERYAKVSDLRADLSAFALARGLVVDRATAAAYMRGVFADHPALIGSQEEKSFMAEQKSGSDLDVFEALAKKKEHAGADETPTPFATGVIPVGQVARKPTLFGLPSPPPLASPPAATPFGSAPPPKVGASVAPPLVAPPTAAPFGSPPPPKPAAAPSAGASAPAPQPSASTALPGMAPARAPVFPPSPAPAAVATLPFPGAVPSSAPPAGPIPSLAPLPSASPAPTRSPASAPVPVAPPLPAAAAPAPAAPAPGFGAPAAAMPAVVPGPATPAPVTPFSAAPAPVAPFSAAPAPVAPFSAAPAPVAPFPAPVPAPTLAACPAPAADSVPAPAPAVLPAPVVPAPAPGLPLALAPTLALSASPVASSGPTASTASALPAAQPPSPPLPKGGPGTTASSVRPASAPPVPRPLTTIGLAPAPVSTLPPLPPPVAPPPGPTPAPSPAPMLAAAPVPAAPRSPLPSPLPHPGPQTTGEVEMDWDDDEKTTVFAKHGNEGEAGRASDGPAVAAPPPAVRTIPGPAPVVGPPPPRSPLPPPPTALPTNGARPALPPPAATTAVMPGSLPIASSPTIRLPPGAVPARPVPPPTPMPRASVPSPPPVPRDLLPTHSGASGRAGSKGRRNLLLVAGAAVALAGVGYLAMPRSGKVAVFVSSGTGALDHFTIIVDGQQRCTGSPCRFELDQGVHGLRAMSEGYLPHEQGISISSGSDIPVNITLSRGAAGTGVRVSGQQPGVVLSVDGKEIGPLPQELKDLEPGSHKLEFKGSDRYAPEEKTVRVVANEITDLGPVSLKVLRGLATFQVRTPGAKVTLVSGRERRQLTDFSQPVEIDTSKNWQVEATKTGHEDLHMPLTFDGSYEKTFVIELQDRSVAGAGAQPASAPPAAPAPAPVNRPSSAVSSRSEARTESSGGGGACTLNINSLPASSLLLDGKPIGNTPRAGVSTTAGAHTVIFVHPEHGRKSQSVSCKSGETKTVIGRLND